MAVARSGRNKGLKEMETAGLPGAGSARRESSQVCRHGRAQTGPSPRDAPPADAGARIAWRALAVCLALGACDTPPPVIYQAQFPPERMQEAQEIVQEVVGPWGLRRADAEHLLAEALGTRGRRLMHGFSMDFVVPGGESNS